MDSIASWYWFDSYSCAAIQICQTTRGNLFIYNKIACLLKSINILAYFLIMMQDYSNNFVKKSIEKLN